MGKTNKKDLINAYKNKPAVGGVYCILCSGSGNRLINSTVDMEGIHNRFRFALSIGSCPDPKLQDDWMKFGGESLSFTVLEELTKAETQSPKEFKDDVDALLEMWLEKDAAEGGRS